MGELSVKLSLIAVVVVAVVVIAAAIIGCNGWNADPSDGRNLKAAGGLKIADAGDKWSVSPDLRQT